GRRKELVTLHSAFSEAVHQRSTRLVLLLGEPGIGKTRLAAELALELEGRATIARGRCLSYGQALSYWPLVEALRSLGEPARSAVEQLTTGEVTSPLQLVATAQRALAHAAAEQPVLLLLEDLHWAEPALLDLLELLCEQPGETPILILCLARPELLEQHREWSNRDSLCLGPLPRGDARSLLRALADAPTESQRERVLDRAAGNPLFLEELSAFLAEGGALEELPPRLQVLLQARLDLLPEPQRLLLSCAALEGTVFHRNALRELLARDDGLTAELRALTRTRLIQAAPAELRGDEGYRFRHQLIRDAAYAELPKAERARLHERFADWLAQHTGARAELEEIAAYHLEQAVLARRELDARDPELEQRAADALAIVAQHVGLRVDRRAAADLWRRVLVLLAEDDPRRPELELELALALTPLAGFREAREVLDHAKTRRSDPALATRIRLADLHLRLYHGSEDVTDAIRRECSEAIALFEECGDHRALAFAWFTLAEADWFDLRGDAEHGFEEAATQARLAGDAVREMFALEMRTVIRAATSTSYARAIEEGEQIAARFHSDPIGGDCLDLLRSFVAYDSGDLAHARRLGRSAIVGIRHWTYPVIAASLNTGQGSMLELLNGQVDEAERRILKGIDELEELGERKYLSIGKAQLARVRVAQGRFEEGLELADEVTQFVGRARIAEFLALGARASACLGLGDIEQAQAAAAKAVAIADTSASVAYRAQAQLGLAAVRSAAGELPAALEAAREAARISATLDRKLLGTRAAALLEQIEQKLATAGAPA
ncbi:MAG TPA: AAA family ATPase, partial [Gaiellaceae bacterium]|nr:AAA family ATPase [Gaiellaceae bacterium]